jgi:hypothetical protein
MDEKTKNHSASCISNTVMKIGQCLIGGLGARGLAGVPQLALAYFTH